MHADHPRDTPKARPWLVKKRKTRITSINYTWVKLDQIDADLMRGLGRKIFHACVFMSTLRPCRDNSLKASVMRRVFLSHQLSLPLLSYFFLSHSFDVLPPNLPWAVDLTETEDTLIHSAVAIHSHGKESIPCSVCLSVCLCLCVSVYLCMCAFFNSVICCMISESPAGEGRFSTSNPLWYWITLL